MNPTVSVIVATYNRAALLRGCLESLLAQDGPEFEVLPPTPSTPSTPSTKSSSAQDGPEFEVVCVDDGSPDRTPELLAEMEAAHPGRLRWTRTENRGPGPARNTGVDMARGAWVVIADDDIAAPPGWLAALWAARARHGAEAVAFALEPCGADTPAARYLHHRNLLATGRRLRRDYVGPAFLLLPREKYLEAGGFSAVRLAAAEDYDFCLRLRRIGVSVLFDPSITVGHHFDTEWAGVARKVRAAARDGARVYLAAGRSRTLLALRALAKAASAPLWSLWAYPPDLYTASLRMEVLFLRERMRALRGCGADR
ncbi:MAG: glycosyltransferase family 2 protein [Candidatus Hydrogenedens sp.]|nr:glycosyltransferase family 2 protein [Candidatus Hydrogenedentota bacterium]NLF57119.1 glycosyltransferase family 2 protein [Candidatus Hydrogenedens sp.]